GPDPRNFNQRASLGRNDLLIRTFPKTLITPFIKQNDPACSQSYLEEWGNHSLVIQKCADYTAAPL
ncbi:hypothetical protein Q7I18_20710, partial [Aeromonas veronii]